MDEVVSLHESGERVGPSDAAFCDVWKAERGARQCSVCERMRSRATPQVATWWPQLFKKPEAMLDLDRDCVIGINIFQVLAMGRRGRGALVRRRERLYGPHVSSDCMSATWCGRRRS